METIESRVEPSPGKSAKPSRWLPLAISVIAAGLMVGLAYYGLQYFRSSTVNDERAFRALREMIGQFGNFQSAIAGLLTLVPSEVNDVTRESFQSSLSLEGQWDLQTDECGTAASPDRHAQLIVDTSTAARDFTMTTMGACQIKGDADKSGARKIKLSESLARQLPTFVAQEQFDVVILSLVDGTTLASIPRQRRSEPGSELHDTGSHSLVVAKVSGLLHHAMRQEEAEDFARTKLASAKDEKRELPPHPVVLTDTIAGETYRIFIQPFEPDYPVTIAQANTASPAPQAENAPKQTPLYLVGLKKQDVFKTLVDTFGSTGTLSITLIVLLAVLTWPLMSLKFSSPQEPISSTQVLAASVALLLIPSVVTVTGFSVWSRHRLDSWADRSAEVYAARVERAVLQELSADARTLDDLATQFAGNPKMVEKHFKMENTNVACLASARDKLASCMFPLTVPGGGSRVPASWSALRSAAPLNLQGESAGLTIDLFGRRAPERPLDLRDRPYFKAIANGEEWHPDELWSHQDLKADRLRLPAHGLVAQRLFNRSDGARVLQVAVPMHSESDERIGLVTADSRAYALAASVRPPLLRFAVIDSANGVVLFHSDDARSLSENLLVETEQNASLRDVMRKRVAPRTLNRVAVRDHFGGLYLGEWQRFYHRPVAGLPWGIVVFYSAESLAEIVLQTAVATLATSFAFSGVVILVFCLLAFMLPGRPDLDILAALWPKWESRERYRTIAACAAIVVLIEACVVVARLRVGSLVAVGVGMACAVIACHAAIAWMRRRKASGGSQSINVRAYQKYYVGCMLGAMCAISVLPTIWFATDYHDVSVAASVRNELGQAADDVELRYGVIAGDLRRFMPDVGIRTRVDHARTLRDALTVPGYEAQPPDERGAVEWLLLDAQPGLWLRACGPPMIGFVRRTIWALSTAEQAQVQRLRSGAIESERDPAAGASQSQKIQTSAQVHDRCADDPQDVRYWRAGQDGSHRIRMVFPLKVSGSSIPLDWDDELRFRYGPSSLLIAVAIAAASIVLLVLMCWHAARRLLGIRIPFTGRYVAKEADALSVSGLLDAELALLELRRKHGAEFTWKDETDWRAVHCKPIYTSAWSVLKPDERLLMHHLARGYFANPENTQVIEHMIRRGYLKLWPWPRIVETGFAEYIRTLDDQKEFAQLQQASHNLWHRIRTPLLIVVVVVAGLLMWLAGSAMQILSATLAGIAALFSSITQVTSFANRDAKPPRQ